MPAPAPPAAAPVEFDPFVSRQVDDALAFLHTIRFQELQRRGWHLQPNHFYWPLNSVEFLRDHPELWHDRGLPRGVDWDLDGQLKFARELAPFWTELADVAHRPAAVDMGSEITLINGSFSGADASAYYGLVRKLQPRRVVEVGAGWSSIFLDHALAQNERPAEVTLIEPDPDRSLLERLPRKWEVRRSLLQFVDPAVFQGLQEGDICFYDGSHCAHTASDVNWFFFESSRAWHPACSCTCTTSSCPTTTTTSGCSVTALQLERAVFPAGLPDAQLRLPRTARPTTCCSGCARTTCARCIPAGTTAAASGSRRSLRSARATWPARARRRPSADTPRRLAGLPRAQPLSATLRDTPSRRVASSERWSASSTRTTRRPAAPSEIGGVPVADRIRTKCSHSVRSGSTFEIRGLQMSPERVMYSPYELACSSKPLS